MLQEKYSVRALLFSWVHIWHTLRSSQGKLLFFALYKNICQTYRQLFFFCGWIFVLLILFAALSKRALYMPFVLVLWSVITVWTVRPSVGKKTYCYFAQSFLLMLQAIVCGICLVALPLVYNVQAVCFFWCVPLYIFFSFFVSDSVPKFSYSTLMLPIKNSLSMFIAQLPFVLILSFATQLFFYMLNSLYYYSYIMLFPALACSMNILYLHARYEQRELYPYE